MHIALKSQFQSGELNLRYWGDLPPGPFDASFIVGGRYMRLAEQFNFSSIADQPAPGGTAIDIQSNTTNDLWGVQVGLEGAWLVSQRWWFDFVMKGGIFNDHITATNNVVNNGVPTLITDTRDRTAWVGDLALTANWQMTPWLTFRAGYQALFFNGLGLAQEQVSSALLTNTPGPLNDSGKIAIHGPTIGLMAYW